MGGASHNRYIALPLALRAVEAGDRSTALAQAVALTDDGLTPATYPEFHSAADVHALARYTCFLPNATGAELASGRRPTNTLGLP